MASRERRLQVSRFSANFTNNYATQAEQIYRHPSELCSTMLETILGNVDVLKGRNRFDEALSVTQSAAKADPKNKQFSALVTQLQTSRR